MNSSKRWAYFFVAGLECPRCRVGHGLTLYGYDKKPIDSEKYTIDELKAMIPRMDAWCSKCGPSFTTRVTGPVRLTKKQDAAFLADLRVSATLAGIYDEHTYEGLVFTKQALMAAVKKSPCAACGLSYPACVMDFHHVADESKRANVSQMLHPKYSIYALISEMNRCCLVCANCHRMITHKYIGSPKEVLQINENFFLSNF